MLIYFLKIFEKENSDCKNVETAENRQTICKKDEKNMQKTRKNEIACFLYNDNQDVQHLIICQLIPPLPITGKKGGMLFLNV